MRSFSPVTRVRCRAGMQHGREGGEGLGAGAGAVPAAPLICCLIVVIGNSNGKDRLKSFTLLSDCCIL